MRRITTRDDLVNWVDDAMGADANEGIVEAVADWIQRQEHPRWGSDWEEYLADLDLWDIATQLGV